MVSSRDLTPHTSHLHGKRDIESQLEVHRSDVHCFQEEVLCRLEVVGVVVPTSEVQEQLRFEVQEHPSRFRTWELKAQPRLASYPPRSPCHHPHLALFVRVQLAHCHLIESVSGDVILRGQAHIGEVDVQVRNVQKAAGGGNSSLRSVECGV